MPASALTQHSQQRCFGGTQSVYSHHSECCDGPMRFSVYRPPGDPQRPLPVLYLLAGLTCNEETFMIKAGAQALAARHGVMLVAPDTSPRGTGIVGEADDWEFGAGAGFYLDASKAPWSAHFRMYSYVRDELPAIVAEQLAGDSQRQSLCGHSMGGHGALTIGLNNPQRYRSISAFAPIVAPSQVPWGEKALPRYLGDDRSAWLKHDACALIDAGHRFPAELLIDQGSADPFLQSQLQPERLQRSCEQAGQPLRLRMQPDYDHSYWFIQSFIADHLEFHAQALKD